MKITTRLYIAAAIPIAIAIILASLVVLFSNKVVQETEKQNLAMETNTAVSELDIVTDEYLMYYEKRMEQQWHSRYDSAMVILDKAVEKKMEMIELIHASFHDLNDLFSRVTTNHEEKQKLVQEGASQEKIDAATLVEEMLTAQLLITLRSIVTDTSRLAENAYTRALKDQEILRNLALASMIILALTVTTSTYLIAGSISVPLSKLANYARRIGEGEYTTEVEVKGKDEIAGVTSTVEAMVGRLLTTQEELKLEIAERRRAEEALREAQEQLVRREKLAVLGQMAGSVSHELRNPLGVISNAVYFLQLTLPAADETTATAREYLEMISEEVRNAGKIISDLLDFSRTRLPDREEIAVSELVAEVLEKQPPPENVEVTTEISPDLPPVYVDPRQMGQVLVNLVTNAYQAMPEGGVLTIKTARLSSPKSEVALSVSDTGCGIPLENLAKIFGPLFTTRARGIGLGLAVSKNLVEANGGSIEVESPSTGLRTGEEGKGSTFTVRLPIKEVVA